MWDLRSVGSQRVNVKEVSPSLSINLTERAGKALPGKWGLSTMALILCYGIFVHPCKILQRHNYRLLFHMKYGIPALMLWKELKPYRQMCCENKCRTPIYCHIWPSMFSDLLAFTLFMLSYSSLTYKLTVCHHLLFSQDDMSKEHTWDLGFH